MKMWKKIAASVIGSIMVLSQGMVFLAHEGVEAGTGSDQVAAESAMPQQGSGIGMNTLAGAGSIHEGLVGMASKGIGIDLGGFGTETEDAEDESDTDTCVLEDIQLTLRISVPARIGVTICADIDAV